MEQGEEETRALKGTYNDSLSEAARAGTPEKGSQSSLEAYASMMQMREEDAAQEMAWALSQSGTLRASRGTTTAFETCISIVYHAASCFL